MEQTELTLEQIRDGLIEMFGDKLPDIDQEPIRFQYFLKLFFYERFLENEQRLREGTTQSEVAPDGETHPQTDEDSQSTQCSGAVKT